LEARDKTAAPNLTLLQVSKQVHNEALTAGWSGLKRCFIDHQILTAVADSKIGLALRFNVLNKMQLTFTTRAWFRFFGIDLDPVIRQDTSASLAHYVRNLSDLATLELRFRDPENGIGGVNSHVIFDISSLVARFFDFLISLTTLDHHQSANL
jgi:hypothetical protein